MLLGLSIALLAAAVLGVQLGESAIGEINPIHFQGAVSSPKGIDPNAARPIPNAFAQAYGWDRGQAARAADCGGDCDAHQSRAAFATVLADPPPEPYWRDVTPAAAPSPPQPRERPLSVERYMHYPVEAEEGEADEDKPAEAQEGE